MITGVGDRRRRLAPAMLAIVTQAVIRVGKRALANPALVALALAAFAALAVFAVPFPLSVRAGQNGHRFPNLAASRESKPRCLPAGAIASSTSGNRSSAGYSHRY